MATLAVQVSPRSAENAVVGWSSSLNDKPELLVKLTASPTDGKANEALIKLLAKELGIPKSRISIKNGHTSRHKLLAIDGEQADFIEKLQQYPNYA